MRKQYHDLSRSQQNRRLQTLEHHLVNIENAETTGNNVDNVNVGNLEHDSDNNLHHDRNNDYLLRDESNNCPGNFVEENAPDQILINNESYENESTKSSSGFGNNIMDVTQRNTRQDLAEWASLYGITHEAVNGLLSILNRAGLDLPKDVRSLLSTPRKTVPLIPMMSGLYLDYGIEKALIEQMQVLGATRFESNIVINVNIDGLPLSKSSRSQLWPILIEVYPKLSSPLVAGAFHGQKKPASVLQFLEPFVTEYNKLHHEGFLFLNRRYTVTIRAIICDSPARAFVKAIKYHNGRFGCSKCTQEGDYENYRLLFKDTNAPLRTDDAFANHTDEDHHTGVSPFEAAGISMVTQFPLDPMHLVYLGVMKKMIGLWINGQYAKARLGSADVKRLSMDLLALRKCVPVEFARKPRGLEELDRWKATEFRTFLFYLSLSVLHKYLPSLYTSHFYSLHCAMTILNDPQDCVRNNNFAEELLVYFVEKFKAKYKLYDENCLIFNVHSLIHLPRDVLTFGSLETFSAFTFENYMQKIKKNIRKGEKPLSQLHNRLIEQSKSIFSKAQVEVYNGPIVAGQNKRPLLMDCTASYDKVLFKDFTLSIRKEADSYCYIEDKIVSIEDIGLRNNKPVLIGRILSNSRSVPNYPIDSKNLGIFIGNDNDWSDVLETFKTEHVTGKAVKLPFNEGSSCFIPLRHSAM